MKAIGFRRTEKSLFRYAAMSGVVSGVAGLGVYLNNQPTPITGRHSIGIVVAAVSTLIALFSFTRYSHRELAEKQIVKRRWTKTANALTIGVAFALITLIVTLISGFAVAGSFKGLTFDPWTAAAITAAIMAFVTYVIISISSSYKVQYGVYALLFVMVGGMTVSMITNQTADWWQVNISNLGTDVATNQTFFNITLIYSGLIILALSTGVFGLYRRWYEKEVGKNRYQIAYVLVMLIGVFLGCVGLFHYEEGTILVQLHNASAGLLGVAAVALMALLRWLIPVFAIEMYIYSWLTAGAMALFFWMMVNGIYFSLTGMEVIDFVIGGAWLLIFLRHILQYGAAGATDKA